MRRSIVIWAVLISLIYHALILPIFLLDSPDPIHPEVRALIQQHPQEKVTVIVEAETLPERPGIIVKSKVGDYITIEVEADKIEEFVEEGQVRKVWPNRKYSILLDESVPIIRAPVMWGEGNSGEGVAIAVLDTGIDATHPMLQGKVIAARDFTNTQVQDVHGHGTHVAGIAAGRQADGYTGVAPAASLINAKVLDDKGDGSTATIINGVQWAVQQGADILLMSFGGPYAEPDSVLNSVIADAIAAGTTVVISAGNCGPGCPSEKCNGYIGITTPGDAVGAITVGATDKSKEWACYSSGGVVEGNIKPDIAAPGTDIVSAVPGSYAAKSGTSMAAPHVAGAIALVLQEHPEYTPAQVKRMLALTAEDLGAPGKDQRFGFGFLDVAQLAAFDPGELFILNYTESLEIGSRFSIDIAYHGSSSIAQASLTITSPIGEVAQLGLERSGNILWQSILPETPGSYQFSVFVDDSYFPYTYSGTFSVAARQSLAMTTFPGNQSALTLNFSEPGEQTVYLTIPRRIGILNATMRLAIMQSLPKQPACGDSLCSNGEDAVSCLQDCCAGAGDIDESDVCCMGLYKESYQQPCPEGFLCPQVIYFQCTEQKEDNASCSADTECISNFCVHDICRPDETFCGDGFCDAGEACAADCAELRVFTEEFNRADTENLGASWIEDEDAEDKIFLANNEAVYQSVNTDSKPKSYLMVNKRLTGDIVFKAKTRGTASLFQMDLRDNDDMPLGGITLQKRDGEYVIALPGIAPFLVYTGIAPSAAMDAIEVSYNRNQSCGLKINAATAWSGNCFIPIPNEVGIKNVYVWYGWNRAGVNYIDDIEIFGSEIPQICGNGVCDPDEDYGSCLADCKRPDGLACAAASDCIGGYCLQNVCRSSPASCGDGYCDPGEDTAGCNIDCSKPDGAACTAKAECAGGYCIRGQCSAVAECLTGADCTRAGCSGTICQPADAEPVITTCQYLDGYACYQQTGCGCINNACAWEETPAFAECMAQYQ